jgi:hypothetical protein
VLEDQIATMTESHVETVAVIEDQLDNAKKLANDWNRAMNMSEQQLVAAQEELKLVREDLSKVKDYNKMILDEHSVKHARNRRSINTPGIY